MESSDRTTRIDIGEENFVPLARVPEYRFTEVYSFAADIETLALTVCGYPGFEHEVNAWGGKRRGGKQGWETGFELASTGPAVA